MAHVQQLLQYIQQTLNPDVNYRKPAEKYLESIETTKGYPIWLLEIIAKTEIDPTLKIAASIIFKNYIKRNWKIDEDQGNKIHEDDRKSIKELIVGLMLKSSEPLQKQLSEAVSKIGVEDFPEKWPHLLNEMTTHFQTGDFGIINGVLQTAHSLFKRYRYEFKSQKLWTEIKYVLDNFAKPLTDLFVNTIELASTNMNNPSALKIIFSSLVLISKVFYSLNYQDLPEFFEDNMSIWMKNFLELLKTDNKLLKTEEDEEAGLLEQLKSQICDNVGLYAQKYDEEFQNYLQGFVSAIWTLLTNTGQQVKYDMLVSNAIYFLSSVALRPHYKPIFEEANVLGSICEKVIIPNMELRTCDVELFEDNPEEFIRRDIEGSDLETRRRAACDLVKALSGSFEARITEVFSQYITAMLQSYSANRQAHWKHKDAAIYLVVSMAIKGQTSKLGITKTSQLVNIADFYRDFIKPDLEDSNVNNLPVLKADAIKYLLIFRSQLPKEMVVSSLPLVIKLMASSSIVVHTYAAHCVEKVLTVQTPYIVSAQDIHNLAEPLLINLFRILDFPNSEENEYVMKAIMRTFSLYREIINPYLHILLPKLTTKLSMVAKNPSKPHFNHYLFETLSLSIRIVCKDNPNLVTSFEENFFPIFQVILEQDIQEFVPYLFQVLSLMLQFHTDVPQTYMFLFPCLLAPILWERPGNIHPLVRLFQAYIEKGASLIVSSGKLDPLLGVFQKLIASKANDHEGFYILQSLLLHLEPNVMEQYHRKIFIILFQRLSNSKTTKFIKGFLVFICLFAYKNSAESLINNTDTIQANMFGMVLERLVIADIQKVSGLVEKKICAVGITHLLTNCPALITGQYSNYWAPLLQALIGLFELPEDKSIPDDEHFIDIEDTPGYQTAYCQLIFAGQNNTDPFNGTIPEPRIFLAQSLHNLSKIHPGTITPLISNGLVDTAKAHLQQYLNAANVQLL